MNSRPNCGGAIASAAHRATSSSSRARCYSADAVKLWAAADRRIATLAAAVTRCCRDAIAVRLAGQVIAVTAGAWLFRQRTDGAPIEFWMYGNRTFWTAPAAAPTLGATAGLLAGLVLPAPDVVATLVAALGIVIAAVGALLLCGSGVRSRRSSPSPQTRSTSHNGWTLRPPMSVPSISPSRMLKTSVTRQKS
jgi:hypothetical protein